MLIEQAGVFQVSGELTFETVMPLWKKSLPLFEKHPILTINLAAVNKTNSAGLALLVEWMRYAKQQHKTILFQDLPPQLVALAQMVGLVLI